jgi:hypothetical protein
MQDEAEKLEEEKLRLAEMEKVLEEQVLRDSERYVSIFYNSCESPSLVIIKENTKEI